MSSSWWERDMLASDLLGEKIDRVEGGLKTGFLATQNLNLMDIDSSSSHSSHIYRVSFTFLTSD